jgi:penicillin-binding protein 1C
MRRFWSLFIFSRKRLWQWLGALAGCCVLLLLSARMLLILVPLPPALFEPMTASVEYLDRNGLPLREASSEGAGIGRPLPLSEMPEALVKATLAAEDARFWRHGGVDWIGTARAAVSLLRYRRIVSGGSTITQQLVKIAAPRPRTFRAKAFEALQAMRLEQIWPKERILEEYLNRLDYGNLRIGAGAAAHFYFQKPPLSMSLAEAALLAGLPQAPTRLNPHAHFNRAKKRQQWILRRMTALSLANPDECERARLEPIQLRPPSPVYQAAHFVDLIIRLHPQLAAAPRRRTIKTTLDLDLNLAAQKTLREQLQRLSARHVQNGAIVVIDNRSGEVLALVGSENYFAPGSGQVNGAWAARSAGSTLKPFTYLLAFERGANPASIEADIPTEFATPEGVFAPENYSRRYYGPVRYRMALANSLNVPAVRVLESIGGAAVLQKWLQSAGLSTLIKPPSHYGLGLTIGTSEVRLLELANAYACLARLGEYKPFLLIEPGSRTPSFDRPNSNPSRLCQAEAAYSIADILSDAGARALGFGFESGLNFDYPVACKTGTSSDFRDNWAIGYTPEFTVGVWVGNFDGTPMQNVSGVSGAAPVMHELFDRLHRTAGTTWYGRPSNMVERCVHPLTGKILRQPCPSDDREFFFSDRLPPIESNADYDAQGRVRLPPQYRRWFESGYNGLGGQVVLDDAPQTSALRILSPLPETVYYLDPDLIRRGSRLPLHADGAGPLEWTSPTLKCGTDASLSFAILTEGRHELIVRQNQTGREARTWIVVKRL